ncbi:hypothetical protein D3C77_688150 [compost metagenome]
MLSWPHCTQALATVKSPSSQTWLRVCTLSSGWPTSSQLPASMVIRMPPASCRLRESGMGKMANRLMSR